MTDPTPGTNAWVTQRVEPIVEPDRIIVDPHHHLWYASERSALFQEDYLLEDLLADTGSGHRVTKTVYIECRAAYREDGPEHLRSIGETASVRRQAELSRQRGGAIIAGIVGHADLRGGDLLIEALDHLEEAGGGLFRGIRHHASWPEYPESLTIPGRAPKGLMADPAYRAGANVLGQRGLTADCWHYHYQNREFAEMARAVPETLFVLNHFGTPLGVGPYADRRGEIMAQWRDDIATIARCENVVAKLGGLAMPDNGYGWDQRALPASSDEIVAAQREYYLHTIDCFGVERCLFESNFPVDRKSVSYAVLYNAFKKMVADFSEAEKDALFRVNAERVYRLE